MSLQKRDPSKSKETRKGLRAGTGPMPGRMLGPLAEPRGDGSSSVPAEKATCSPGPSRRHLDREPDRPPGSRACAAAGGGDAAGSRGRGRDAVLRKQSTPPTGGKKV